VGAWVRGCVLWDVRACAADYAREEEEEYKRCLCNLRRE
jgi:hypothetical protein